MTILFLWSWSAFLQAQGEGSFDLFLKLLSAEHSVGLCAMPDRVH